MLRFPCRPASPASSWSRRGCHIDYIDFDGTAWGATDSPNNVAKLRYAEPLFDGKAKLGVENIFVGKRTTLYYNKEDRYNLVNATVSSKEILPGVDISFSVYNLFNSSRNMIGGPPVLQDLIPMNGRSMLLTLRKTF